jgi:hypothetical protein
MTAPYQLAEVMLPRGRVYHLQLLDAHPQVWEHLSGRGWPAWRPSRPVTEYPVLLCVFVGDRDDLIPGSGRRPLCRECEDVADAIEGTVDELRWQTAETLARQQPDETTRAYLGRVGW